MSPTPRCLSAAPAPGRTRLCKWSAPFSLLLLAALAASACGGSGGTTPPPPAVASIAVAPASPSVAVGATQQFTATAKDASGNVMSGVSFTWASSATSIATVSASGLATAVAAGTTQITASSGGVTSTADTLTVTNPPVTTITVAPASPTIAAGATQQFTATALDANGKTLSGVSFTWASSATSVATVDSTGKATGVGAGATQITATAGGATSTADTLTVTAAVATVTLAPLAPAIQVGQTQQFTATAKDAGGNPLTGLSFTWASSSTATATIDSSGLATGVAAGTTQITAAAGGVTSAPDTLTVNVAGTVSGTAAMGAPLANLTVTLKDSTGTQRTSTTGADGSFSIATGGLTPPFLVMVQPAAGNPLYSVSADPNLTTTINLDPLTDLIIRSWYSAQGASVDTAFATPAAQPPPTPVQVTLIGNVVTQIAQLWLTNNGLDPSTFNFITTPFAADSTGFDKVLDETTVDTSAGTVKITDGATTQNTTLTYSTPNTTVTAATTTTNGTNTSTSTTTTVVPAQTAAAAALAGINTTLAALVQTVQTKGANLANTDLGPFIASDLLHDGENASIWADDIVTTLRGFTIASFAMQTLNSLDTTNNIADASFALVLTTPAGAVTQNLHLPFKLENGSWLMYGDQRLGSLSLTSGMLTNQGAQTSTNADLNIDFQAPRTPPAFTQPTVSGITVTGGGIWNTPTAFTASGTVDDTLAPTPTSSLDEISDHWFQSQDNLSSLVPAATPFTFVITPTTGAAETVVVNSNAASTEPVAFSGITSSAVSSLQFGTPLTYSWTLPATFPIQQVKLNAQVFTGDQTLNSTVACNVKQTPIPTTATSGQITLPSTCNGQPVVQVNVNLVVIGANGERSQAIIFYQ